MTAEQAADPGNLLDEHSVEGEPACCEKAIAEFRTEHGIPLPVEPKQPTVPEPYPACPCGQDGCEFCDPEAGDA
jgi:hypothetical protein